jgi:CspA family cold shock protein
MGLGEVVSVPVGRILRFDEGRGYGFIAPAGGGEDVFVHANDFGPRRHLVHPGMRVEYEVESGDRGLKVAQIRILDEGSAPVNGTRTKQPVAMDDDDGLCDVLAPREYTTEVTEVLIQHVQSLSGAQIAQVREQMVSLARSHGWVES